MTSPTTRAIRLLSDGAIKLLLAYDAGVVSSLYLCFKLRDDVDADFDFFRHYFEAGLLNQEIEGIAQEGARNHGLLNVSVTDFFKLQLHIPTAPEQRRIAEVINVAMGNKRLQDKCSVAARKAALMSQLLTGKRRVKLPDAEAGAGMNSTPNSREQYSAHLPALHLLCNLGWNFLTTAQALTLRGSTREVLLKPRLIEVLQTRRYEYKGQWYPLSPSGIDQIVRELSALSLAEGLMPANERLYGKLALGITVTEFMPDGKKHQPTIR
jgi:hypothetical protein